MTFARLLLAALLSWGWAGAHAYTVLERVQWYDADHSSILPPTDDAAWQATGSKIRRGYETGALWLRLRVQKQGLEDLYLSMRRSSVDDVAVWVQLPSDGRYRFGAPGDANSPLATLSANDMRDGLLLIPKDVQDGEVATIWIRVHSARIRWFDVNILSQSELLHQTALDWSNVAVQLTFSLLLLLASLTQYAFSGRKIYRLMMALALCEMLYQLQLSGALLCLTGPDPARFVSLNVAITVLTGSVALYAGVLVLATPGFRYWAMPWLYALLACSLMAGLAGLLSGWAPLNLVATVCIGLGMCVFVVNFIGFTLKRASWYRGNIQGFLSAVFILVLLVNIIYIGSLFFSWLEWARSDYLRIANWPVVSATLFLTLVWKQQRVEAASNRRRMLNARKLQEQVRIGFAQQQFITMMAHEIKTPLTVMQLSVKALSQTDISPLRKASWEARMQTAISSVVHILDNCSHAERLDGGLMVSTPSVFAVPAALEQVLSLGKIQLHGADIALDLQWDSESTDLFLHSDLSFFQIILSNLVGNALKYAAANTQVTLRISRVPDALGGAGLQFAVSNVPGSAGAPDPDQVFSRYYRAPGAKEISGTGLGLWLSQQIAQSLGTKIRMHLEGGRVVFWFSLPEVRADGSPA